MVVDPEGEEIDGIFIDEFDGPDFLSPEAKALLKAVTIKIPSERPKRKGGRSHPKGKKSRKKRGKRTNRTKK